MEVSLISSTKPLIKGLSSGSDLVAYTARTKTHERLILAKEKGYYVTEDGKLFSPYRELSFKLYGSQRYPSRNIKLDGKNASIPVHHLAAYCFYGNAMFQKGIVVRHLNADVLDITKNNIVLGTPSQNEFDKTYEQRSLAAKKARASQGERPCNSKLTTTEVKEIRNAYAAINRKKAPNGFQKALCQKFNICRSTIDKIQRGDYYAG